MTEHLIVRMTFGSSLYGTSTPASDSDFKGVFIPSRRDILLQQAPRARSKSTRPAEALKNSAGDTDTEDYSLHYFVKLLLEGQTTALDMLFAPPSAWMNRSQSWRDIVERPSIFLSRGCTAFVGYCMTQASKYGIRGSRVAAVRETIVTLEELAPETKLVEHIDWFRISAQGKEHVAVLLLPERKDGPLVPYLEVCNRKFAFTLKVGYVKSCLQKILGEYGARALAAEKNEGIDWKALSHAVRVIEEAKELLRMHTISFPLRDAERIRDIKIGKYTYQEVAPWIEQGLLDVERARDESTLPDEPDREAAEDLVARIYETEST